MEKLSIKHEAFCQEFMKDRNQTQAFIRAGYSESNARAGAARLCTKANIKARIAELTSEIQRSSELSQEKVRKFWNDTLDSTETPLSIKAIVSRDAAKHMGMFVEKHEHEHRGDLSFTVVVHSPTK